MAALITQEKFGLTSDQEVVTLYTMTTGTGLSVSIMDYGATVVRVVVPDRTGKLSDVALGFETFAPYETNTPYFGSTIGRYANRIGRGQFSLNGKTYSVAQNNGVHSLHGGLKGFDKRFWKVQMPQGPSMPHLRFSRSSPDGEEGYPGNLEVRVTFLLTPNHELAIGYEATTDQETVVNLTNHTYFNLAGAGVNRSMATILDHHLTLHADSYTPVDESLIPTGEISSVLGTVMDFRQATAIGARIAQVGGNPVGYDHNWVLNKRAPHDFSLAAEVYEPVNGRTLSVMTHKPGLQFYSGNFLDGTLLGKGGQPYVQHSGFCLETQYFPDSPNHPQFPSTLLRPGTTYQTNTTYAFGVR